MAGNTLDIPAITAASAGAALATIASKLSAAGILAQTGFLILQHQALEVRRLGDAVSWTVFADPEEPIEFEWADDKNQDPVEPSIAADVRVDQSVGANLPFVTLDLALQVRRPDTKEPVARWHVDLANGQDDVMQDGPMFHLQFGGHQRGHRELDHPLKVPRWCHPPLEVGLMCELVATNFFTSQWLELRDDPAWCDAISVLEKLCFPVYLNKLVGCLSQSSTTALNQMWATDWAKALQKQQAG